MLRVLRSSTPSVLAAPAGVILDPAVRTSLSDSIVVWLRADPATLAGRVRAGDHRPLLEGRPLATLTAMAEARSGLYQQVATAIFDTDDASPDAVADAIVGLVTNNAAYG